MARNYTPQQQRATLLIEKFGGPATLIRQGAKTGDEWNPTFAAGIEHQVTICQINNSLNRREAETVREGDLFGIMATPEGVVPGVNDQLEIGSNIYSLEQVRPFQPNPAGSVVYYEYQARQ